MKITLTIGELFDRGLWTKYCEISGTNDWAMAEGLANKSDKITLSEFEAMSLGLTPKKFIFTPLNNLLIRDRVIIIESIDIHTEHSEPFYMVYETEQSVENDMAFAIINAEDLTAEQIKIAKFNNVVSQLN